MASTEIDCILGYLLKNYGAYIYADLYFSLVDFIHLTRLIKFLLFSNQFSMRGHAVFIVVTLVYKLYLKTLNHFFVHDLYLYSCMCKRYQENNYMSKSNQTWWKEESYRSHYGHMITSDVLQDTEPYFDTDPYLFA